MLMHAPCPACGKNVDLGVTSACPRCSCDLAPLAACLGSAMWHLRAAATELRLGDWPAASKHAEQSWSLRHSAQAARIGSLAAMALGDTLTALQWRRRATAR